MAAAKKEDFIENCYLAGEINLCWGGGGRGGWWWGRLANF